MLFKYAKRHNFKVTMILKLLILIHNVLKFSFNSKHEDRGKGHSHCSHHPSSPQRKTQNK